MGKGEFDLWDALLLLLFFLATFALIWSIRFDYRLLIQIIAGSIVSAILITIPVRKIIQRAIK